MGRILLRRRWLVLLPFAIGVAVPSPSQGAVWAGGVAGLAAGLVLTALLEYRNSSFSCMEDVVRALALPVLGTVPVIASARERQVRRYRQLAADLTGAAALLLALALALWRLRA